MIIAVTGWRHYADGGFIRRCLIEKLVLCCDVWEVNLHIRVGDAEGADAHVRRWCEINKVSHHVFRARRFPGGALKPGAGPQRNLEMLEGIGDPMQGPTDLLLAFPPGTGRITVPGSGTWGCAIMASQMGIRVEIPAYPRTEN